MELDSHIFYAAQTDYGIQLEAPYFVSDTVVRYPYGIIPVFSVLQYQVYNTMEFVSQCRSYYDLFSQQCCPKSTLISGIVTDIIWTRVTLTLVSADRSNRGNRLDQKCRFRNYLLL